SSANTALSNTTIVVPAGVYAVHFSVAYLVNTAPLNIFFQLTANGVNQPNIQLATHEELAARIVNASFGGILTLAAPATLAITVSSPTASTLTTFSANWFVTKIA